MSDLAEILGQRDIVISILKEFDSNPNNPKVVTLRGNSGTGKSYISGLVYEMWTGYDDLY
jgi:ABC-type dipeptide/oligopeptide/nickel transport system ATPase subunit